MNRPPLLPLLRDWGILILKKAQIIEGWPRISIDHMEACPYGKVGSYNGNQSEEFRSKHQNITEGIVI